MHSASNVAGRQRKSARLDGASARTWPAQTTRSTATTTASSNSTSPPSARARSSTCRHRAPTRGIIILARTIGTFEFGAKIRNAHKFDDTYNIWYTVPNDEQRQSHSRCRLPQHPEWNSTFTDPDYYDETYGGAISGSYRLGQDEGLGRSEQEPARVQRRSGAELKQLRPHRAHPCRLCDEHHRTCQPRSPGCRPALRSHPRRYDQLR